MLCKLQFEFTQNNNMSVSMSELQERSWECDAMCNAIIVTIYKKYCKDRKIQHNGISTSVVGYSRLDAYPIVDINIGELNNIVGYTISDDVSWIFNKFFYNEFEGPIVCKVSHATPLSLLGLPGCKKWI